MFQTLVNLPRWVKYSIILSFDLIAIPIAYYLAICLRVNSIWPQYWVAGSVYLVVATVVFGAALFFAMGLHTIKLAAFEKTAAIKTSIWVAILSATGFTLNYFYVFVPRTTPVIFGPFLFMLVLFSRQSALTILAWLGSGTNNRTPVAIYGAGSGGLQLISALRGTSDFNPVLLVDDKRTLQGLMISGLRVLSPEAFAKRIHHYKIETVFLAIPSIGEARKSQIVQQLKSFGCNVMELPSYPEIIQSGGLLKSLRPVSIDSLLGRSGVDLDMPTIRESYQGSSVMVTGAGGSIGSELCRKLMDAQPSRLVLFDQSELALYRIELELREAARENGVTLLPVLGSVCDRKRIRKTLRENNVQAVFHAAAYKHVPLTETNELECIHNNVIGTHTVVTEASKQGVARFTLVSTDKAVRPTSVMGASKRLAELIVQNQQDEHPNSQFASVRFGNVLGSSGSVVPLFRQQIEAGGPVTVTHTDVNRFFMTIPEAAQLVLLAGSFAEGGEVFLLDMGEPIRIIDLARQMIELSGFSVKDENNPNGDIEICITGLRDGEKLYEELLIGGKTLPTPHAKILRSREDKYSKSELKSVMTEIKQALKNEDPNAIRNLLAMHAGLKERTDAGCIAK